MAANVSTPMPHKFSFTVKLKIDNFLLCFHQVETIPIGKKTVLAEDGSPLCADIYLPDYELRLCTDKNLGSTVCHFSEHMIVSAIGCKTSAAISSLTPIIQQYFKQHSNANSSHLCRQINELSCGNCTISEYHQEGKTCLEQLRGLRRRI